MDIHVFTMVEAVHLVGTASDNDSEDMSAWSRTFVTVGEALLTARKAIRDRVYEFYEGSDIDDDEIEKIIGSIYEANDFQWSWDTADRSYIWRIVEDDICVHRDCDDESDTTMGQLGYRKDDSEHVDKSGYDGYDDCEYPRLSVGFKNANTPESDMCMEFSTPEEALAWAAAYDGGSSEFSSTWLPGVIRAVYHGRTREVHDCAGDWEDFIGELAYACGDEGSFSDPDELKRRDEKYREWYQED